jgi:hypothetical protein
MDFDFIVFGKFLGAILDKHGLPLENYGLQMNLTDLDLDEISINWQHHRKGAYKSKELQQDLDFDELAKDLLSLIDNQGLRIKRMGLTVLMPDAEFSELARKNPDYYQGEIIRKIIEEKDLLWFIQVIRKRGLPVNPD